MSRASAPQPATAATSSYFLGEDGHYALYMVRNTLRMMEGLAADARDGGGDISAEELASFLHLMADRLDTVLEAASVRH